jgi:maltokinase
VRVLETIAVSEDPALSLAVVEVAFRDGPSELYQLPVGFRPEGTWDLGVIEVAGGRVVYDALTDPALVRVLVDLMGRDADIATGQGVAVFRALGPLAGPDHVRPMGAEQSNTSVVLDERTVLKAFRRLGGGLNPELEILRFLTRRDFPHIATLRGYYQHDGGRVNGTMGLLQDFLGGSIDGWNVALDDLREAPERFPDRAHALGEVTGRLHSALAADPTDPDFAPEESPPAALEALAATVGAEVDELFAALPPLPALDPIRGRAGEVRDHLRALTTEDSAGLVIRHHGDFHLGQAMYGADGEWVLLDFEGEPARSSAERRRKRSPLRDVAGMLRSFAYAATASELIHGTPAPEAWEDEVRAAYLRGYFAEIDAGLLPPGRAGVDRLLAVFELEKVVYELRYELDNRPDWVRIPVAGIVRLLQTEMEEAR